MPCLRPERVHHADRCPLCAVSFRWLGFRLEFLGNIVVLAAAMFAVVTPDLDGGLVGLSVSYAMQVSVCVSYAQVCVVVPTCVCGVWVSFCQYQCVCGVSVSTHTHNYGVWVFVSTYVYNYGEWVSVPVCMWCLCQYPCVCKV